MTADDQIHRLLYEYAHRIDNGDFAAVGALFAHGQIRSGDLVVRGAPAVQAHFEASVRRFDDGTPHTRHVTSNVVIDVDEAGESAHARSYVTVFFQAPGLAAVEPIYVGAYQDEFACVDEEWRFAERTYQAGLTGDQGSHLLASRHLGSALAAGAIKIEHAIRQVLYRCARAFDDTDIEVARSCFATDATVNGESVPAHLTTLASRSPGSWQRSLIHNVTIEERGEGVTSAAYVTVESWRGTSGAIDTLRGRYLDEWTRAGNGAWLIARRIWQVDLHSQEEGSSR